MIDFASGPPDRKVGGTSRRGGSTPPLLHLRVRSARIIRVRRTVHFGYLPRQTARGLHRKVGLLTPLKCASLRLTNTGPDLVIDVLAPAEKAHRRKRRKPRGP